MQKAKLIFWLGLVLGASLRLVVQPVKAAFTIDGSWGAPCPECLEDDSCDGITGPNDEGDWCITVPDSECQEAGVDRPDEVCRTSGPDAWIYTFVVQCQKCTVPARRKCLHRYEYETKDCSASDRCEGGPNQIGACQRVSDAEMFSVSNSSGHILSGRCAASDCSEEGCKNGGWYKTPGDSHLGGDCHLRLQSPCGTGRIFACPKGVNLFPWNIEPSRGHKHLVLP